MGFTCSYSFAAPAAVPPAANSTAAAGTTPETVTGHGSVDFAEAQGEAASTTAGS